MLSPSPPARPNAAAFASCQWFQEDVALRALRFLDTMLQRDAGQKVRGRSGRGDWRGLRGSARSTRVEGIGAQRAG